jgi:tetratricopeptide (TPR) repeat protein
MTGMRMIFGWAGPCLLAVLAGGCSANRATTAGTAGRSSWFSFLKPAPKVPEGPPPIIVPDKLKDERELTLTYAEWMVDRGQLQVARQKYRDVLQKHPQDVMAIIGLARIDELNGQLEDAELALHKAVSLSPDTPVTHSALGQFYSNQKRWTDATDSYNKAVLADPCDKDARYHLAVALVRRGDVAGALPHFIRTVGDAEAHYNAAVILKEEGRLREAQEQAEIAMAKKPELVKARELLAAIRRPERSDDGREPTIMPAGGRTTSKAPSVTPASASSRIPSGRQIQAAVGHSVSG